MRIEVRDARKRFGAVAALDGVSFVVEPGQRLAIVGPNGSGKSTLNRVLMGLIGCRGEVRIDGRCPFRERVAVAQRMAYVPQAAPQLAAPVAEVVGAIARVRALAPAAVRGGTGAMPRARPEGHADPGFPLPGPLAYNPGAHVPAGATP